MNKGRCRQSVNPEGVLVALTPFLLVACSGPVETQVSSSGNGISGPVSILAEPGPANPVAASAYRAVAALLAKRGIATRANGEYQLQVGVSEDASTVAIYRQDGLGKAAVATAKKPKPLQSCADRQFRLTIALTRISDGALIYRGSALENHCKATLADAIPELANRALADLVSPKGVYTTTRSGVD